MYIKCCNHDRKAKSWYITPQKGYIECIMTFLRDCPACGRSAIRLDRWKMKDKKIEYVPYTLEGADAWDLFLKLESLIIRPYSAKKDENRPYIGYDYNEYGKIKKGYSNLTALKIGRLKPNIDVMDMKYKSQLLV